MVPQQHNGYAQKKAMLSQTCTMLRSTHASSSARSSEVISIKNKLLLCTDKNLDAHKNFRTVMPREYEHRNTDEIFGNWSAAMKFCPVACYSNPQSRLWTDSYSGNELDTYRHFGLTYYERVFTNQKTSGEFTITCCSLQSCYFAPQSTDAT